MSLVEINPLEFPGRTEMIWPNTLGLFATFIVFSAAFYITQRLASWLNPDVQHSGSFIFSMIPIAFGYHFAHYLPTFIVDIQYALIALSDPFGVGWNIFGTANWVVSSSHLSNCVSFASTACSSILEQDLVGTSSGNSVDDRLYSFWTVVAFHSCG